MDAASLDRFALVEIDYSPAIEEAIARGDEELVRYIRTFRKSCREVGIKHLATYRSIERIAKLASCMDLKEVLKMALLKSLCTDDMKIIVENMRSNIDAGNKYFLAMKKIATAS